MAGVYGEGSCTGTSLVPGAARGERVWFLDRDGWLRGVTYRQPWLPGENVAACWVTRGGGTAIRAAVDHYVGISGGVGFPFDANQAPTVIDGYERTPCEGLEYKCSCGFYAYHQGVSNYGFTGGPKVHGIIEGYGRVILGSKGFRAEKARIIALCLPHAYKQAQETCEVLRGAIAEVDDRIEELRRERRKPHPGATLLLVGAAAAATMAITSGGPVWWGTLGATLMAAAVTQQFARLGYRAIIAGLEAERLKLAEALVKTPPDYVEYVDRMVRRYPDVPVYETIPEMFAAHPVENLGYLLESKGESA